jgi:hypothetical protein
VLDYKQLPGGFVDDILSGHFRSAPSAGERAAMLALSTVYSKSRGEAVHFEGDSESKQGQASREVTDAAATYLDPVHARLDEWRARGVGALKASVAGAKDEERVFSMTGSRFFSQPQCPDEPTFPEEFPLMDLIDNWNPDSTEIPERHYNSICRLDYQKDYDKAMRWREAEVPFIVYNIPEVDEASAKWMTPGYLHKRLGKAKWHTEISHNNHFMYYRLGPRKSRDAWTPPTRAERWTYDQWLKKATAVQNISAEQEHYYFRVSYPEAPFVVDDIPIFAPKPSLFIKEPKHQRGIHCRFGMKGVIAESHFDSSRNSIAVLYGLRRWIIQHPRECENIYLLPVSHPSGRHSEVDWSKPDLQAYPAFKNARASEMILAPGDVLYLPAWWLHYIVNLNINAQCNTRSGNNEIGLAELEKCGFRGMRIEI